MKTNIALYLLGYGLLLSMFGLAALNGVLAIHYGVQSGNTGDNGSFIRAVIHLAVLLFLATGLIEFERDVRKILERD